MGESDINNYPSMAIQQYRTKIAFLIDCDQGLSAAFRPRRPKIIKPELIKDFPPNSDIFLFFNSNDSFIVNRMKELESNNPTVHVFPNIIRNARNGAEMNLSFMLGAINNKYDDYVIIVGRDKAYEEIKERLENVHPHLKNHVAVHQFNGLRELAQYVHEMNKGQNEDQHKSEEASSEFKSAGSVSPITVTFTSENPFRHCPLETWQQSSCLYRFKELLLHLDDKHSEISYQYCPTCEEMLRKNDRSKHPLFQEHLQKDHLENDAGFHLSIRSRQQDS